MPTRNCGICNRLQNFSKDDYKYLDKDGEIVCSVHCCIDWLYMEEADHPWDIPEDDTRSLVELNGDHRQHNAYSNYLKEWFASHFEMHVAEVFKFHGHRLEYERWGFEWGYGRKHYTPDFFYQPSNSFLEVKGKWQASNRSKYKSFRENWEEIRMLVIPWTLDEAFRIERRRLGLA